MINKNIEYYETLKRDLAGGNHYNFRNSWLPEKIAISKGCGERIFDIEGNEYIDFFSNFGANIIGHNNQEYLQRIFNYMSISSSSCLSDLSEEVSTKIKNNVKSIELLRFALSGSEVVQTSIRLSRAYTKKEKFLRFTGNYHGHYDNILGGKPGAPVPYPIEFKEDARFSNGIAKGIKERESYIIPWNNEDILKETIEKYKDEIACVITEPLGINAGGIKPKKGYLELLEKLCKENNIVLIFDEIITGIRTGLGGIQARYGIKPDITLLGKAISGGIMPVSVIGGKKEIMELLENREVVQAGTFNGYHAGLGAVNTTLDLLSKNNCERLENMFEKSRILQKTLLNIANEFGLPMTIQGHDGCFYIHICENELNSTEEWTADIKHKDELLQKIFLKYGIMIAATSRVYMNIDLNDDDIELFEKNARSALKEVREIIL